MVGATTGNIICCRKCRGSWRTTSRLTNRDGASCSSAAIFCEWPQQFAWHGARDAFCRRANSFSRVLGALATSRRPRRRRGAAGAAAETLEGAAPRGR